MPSVEVFFEEMIVLIAFLGFLIRKIEILNDHTDDVLTHLILYITLPALTLFSLDVPFSIVLEKSFYGLFPCLHIYYCFLFLSLNGCEVVHIFHVTKKVHTKV